MLFTILKNLNHNGQLYQIGERIEGEIKAFASLIEAGVMAEASKVPHIVPAPAPAAAPVAPTAPEEAPTAPAAPEISDATKSGEGDAGGDGAELL